MAIDQPCADAEKAARRLLEQPAPSTVQDGHIYMEKINACVCSASSAFTRMMSP
jgi:hypothetical protein